MNCFPYHDVFIYSLSNTLKKEFIVYNSIFSETIPLIVTKLLWNIILNQDAILVICAYVDNRFPTVSN